MQQWEYIPFRASAEMWEELNKLADEYDLNRSTTLRILVRWAVRNQKNKTIQKAFRDASEKEPRSRPRGSIRKDKRKVVRGKKGTPK